MTDFTLNPRLASGGHLLATINNCDVLLKNNAHYPWFVVVPHISETKTEITHLTTTEYQNINNTTLTVSQFIEQHFSPSKLNIGNIANIVRQMHIHIIGRTETDPAWPEVVWGHQEKIPYSDQRVEELKNAFTAFLAE
ncbi:MAG: HIT domain-containing protein [Akkermansiaceae bacterium]